MGLLIDASIFIAQERGTLPADFNSAGHVNELLFVSVITASELLHGVHRASSPVRARKRSRFVEAILDRFEILEIDLSAARTHAKLWAGLARKGTLIGAHDLWIGAHALSLEHGVLTMNPRDFSKIPGLEVRTLRS